MKTSAHFSKNTILVSVKSFLANMILVKSKIVLPALCSAPIIRRKINVDKDVIVHEKFNVKGNLENDIALIRIEEAVPLHQEDEFKSGASLPAQFAYPGIQTWMRKHKKIKLQWVQAWAELFDEQLRIHRQTF